MKLNRAPLARIALACLLATAGAAHAQQTYKVAYIDPLSGPFANVGELMLMHTQYAIEDINARGGVLGGTKLQLLQFDSKLSAQESQSALQAATTRARRRSSRAARARRWSRRWCSRWRAGTSATRARS